MQSMRGEGELTSAASAPEVGHNPRARGWWALKKSITPCRVLSAAASSPCAHSFCTKRSCPFIQTASAPVNTEPSEADTRVCPGLSGRTESTIRCVLSNCVVNVGLQPAKDRIDAAKRTIRAATEAALVDIRGFLVDLLRTGRRPGQEARFAKIRFEIHNISVSLAGQPRI